MTFLGPQINFLLCVKEHLTVQLNVTFIRFHNPRDTPKRHTFSAAGGTQNTCHAFSRLKLSLQGEISQLFSDIHIQ